jgi:nucleoporin NUP159
MQQQLKPPAHQPEVCDLSDNEDERIRQELSREIVPKRTLDTFIAHQDYTAGSPTKTGHAAQIEIIYRDINSMVDTLGLNSRSLAAFIQYHSDARQDRLTRADLEDAEDQGLNGPWFDEWHISELEALSELVTNLEADLTEGRVQDVQNKMSQLSALLNRSAKLTTKLNDIRRQIINRKDPEKAEALRKASLPKELAEQQKALRTEYAKLLSQIGKGEEAMLMLKSKLAAHNGMNGKAGAVPTVDAIKRTIQKMIQLTEKRNNDIMVLESQLRKIGLGESSRPASSPPRTMVTPSRSSRALRNQSPFATPPTHKSSRMSFADLNKKAMTPEQEDMTPSRGYGLFYTPEGSPTSGDSLVRLANKMDDESLTNLRETAQRRRKLARGLADAVLKRGVKVTSIA